LVGPPDRTSDGPALHADVKLCARCSGVTWVTPPARFPGVVDLPLIGRRNRGESVNRFAALIDGLLFTPARNGKLRLMAEYFATVPDPERGWALAALTGELSFAEAKPGQVRALAVARVDPELLAWSYDFVGDLAETVSLIWPADDPEDGAPVPALSEIVAT